MTIATVALHNSFVGMAYNRALSVTGGLSPYTWSISSGSLPSGLTLEASTGIISGTPMTIGTSNFAVQVADSSNTSISKNLVIAITGFSAMSGIVSDQTTGTPIPGAQVSLSLTGIKNRNSNGLLFSCNGSPVKTSSYDTVAENDAVKLDCKNNSALNIMQFKARNPFGGTDAFQVQLERYQQHNRPC